MKAPIITMTTDFGQRDGYVGAMRGVVLAICPEARLVDISHDIPPQDVRHASIVLRPWAPRSIPHAASTVLRGPPLPDRPPEQLRGNLEGGRTQGRLGNGCIRRPLEHDSTGARFFPGVVGWSSISCADILSVMQPSVTTKTWLTASPCLAMIERSGNLKLQR